MESTTEIISCLLFVLVASLSPSCLKPLMSRLPTQSAYDLRLIHVYFDVFLFLSSSFFLAWVGSRAVFGIGVCYDIFN